MPTWQIILLGLLVLYSILVAFDSSWAGGAIFDRDRWPIVAISWTLIIVIWLGSGAYGVWAKKNMYENQIEATIEALEPHRAAIKTATGIDPLAEFIIKSDDTSGASDN